MRIQNKKFFASILFVLISFVCMAQRPSEGLPTPPSPPPPPGLPIDGAIPVVLIAALIYGIKNKQNA
ncbi:hypothetical protein NA63_0856 [Flavobacteriaceae bacterium MAR_2010_105]|nr:hypothetical protein NA63_0856 [Flavobacteriaceae bacterium MAR_2010_105]